MLICLEAQAVTAADLNQKQSILACLDFRLVLSLVEIPVDLCSAQLLDRHVLDRSTSELLPMRLAVEDRLLLSQLP